MITGTLPSGERVTLEVAVVDDQIELRSSQGWSYQLDLAQAIEVVQKLCDAFERIGEKNGGRQ